MKLIILREIHVLNIEYVRYKSYPANCISPSMQFLTGGDADNEDGNGCGDDDKNRSALLVGKLRIQDSICCSLFSYNKKRKKTTHSNENTINVLVGNNVKFEKNRY